MAEKPGKALKGRKHAMPRKGGMAEKHENAGTNEKQGVRRLRQPGRDGIYRPLLSSHHSEPTAP